MECECSKGFQSQDCHQNDVIDDYNLGYCLNEIQIKEKRKYCIQ